MQTGTTFTTVQDIRWTWRRFTVTGTANTAMGIASENFTYMDYGPYFGTRMRFGNVVTGLRLYAGLWTASPDNADTQTTVGLRGVGVRYSTVAGDTGFVPISWDGATQTTGTQIGTVLEGEEYIIEVQVAVGGLSATITITQAGNAAVTSTVTIGSACSVANSTNNVLKVFGFFGWTTENVAKQLDTGGSWCNAFGRND